MQLNSPVITSASPDQNQVLTEIAMASKAHWGYDDKFMSQCEAELTISEAFILNPAHQVSVASCPKTHSVIGFSAIVPTSNGDMTAELEALFISPSHIGTGLGSMLFRHCCGLAREAGYKKLYIQSDPYAEAFYQKMGAVTVATKASQSIPNRTLPLMLFDL